MQKNADPLLSVTEAAAQIGVNRSTLFRQIKAGAVRSHEGKVRLSELLADRAANIDLTRSRRHAGRLDDLSAAAPDATVVADDATADATRATDATDDGAEPDAVIVDGVAMDYADARALKETYLAKLKQLEFETKRGELGRVKDMQDRNDEVAMVVRERLLSIPGECSDVLTQDQVEFVRDKIYDAMEDLSALGSQAEDHVASARGADDGDAAPDEAAAAPRPGAVGRAVPARRAEDQRRPG